LQAEVLDSLGLNSHDLQQGDLTDSGSTISVPNEAWGERGARVTGGPGQERRSYRARPLSKQDMQPLGSTLRQASIQYRVRRSCRCDADRSSEPLA